MHAHTNPNKQSQKKSVYENCDKHQKIVRNNMIGQQQQQKIFCWEQKLCEGEIRNFNFTHH